MKLKADIDSIPENYMDEAALLEHVKRTNPTPHIFLATPAYGGRVCQTFVQSLLRFQAWCIQNRVKLTTDFTSNESLITRARSIMAERSIRSGANWLLFIDADIAFNPITILRLMALDAPVGCGIYAKKAIDWNKVAKDTESTTPEDLASRSLGFNLNIIRDPNDPNQARVKKGYLRITEGATGCMLIRRDVLSFLRDTYFEDLGVQNDIPGSSSQSTPEYAVLFDTSISQDSSRRFLSEDYSFCRMCDKHGFDIYCDVTARLSHTGCLLYTGNLKHRVRSVYTASGV